MKKALILVIATLVFFSCEREYLIPQSEVPKWLKVKIAEDEAYAKDKPSSMIAWGTWSRTKWNDQLYYEYYNPLSSSLAKPISHNQDTLNTYVGVNESGYNSEKCCSVIVWEGPGYKNMK